MQVHGYIPFPQQTVRGGRDLSITSQDNTRILQIADSGQALGLPSALNGQAYQVTAETLGRSQIVFIHRDDFSQLMASHPEVLERSIDQMTEEYQKVIRQLRLAHPSTSVTERLARLLLDLIPANGDEPHLNVSITHTEIGELLCSSREAITRAFTKFKRLGIVQCHGAKVKITNRAALEKILRK